VILSLVSKNGPTRHAGALVVLTLATFACGCGSSEPTASPKLSGGKKLEDVVPPEKLYKYEGTAKTKVELSRRERRELLNEAVKKGE
jgi:hypothetical protein